MIPISLSSTSIEAFHSIDTTELESRVLAVIARTEESGCISDDVRKMLPTLSYSSVTARFASLEEKGLIFKAGDTRPGDSGRQQKVMREGKFSSVVPKIEPLKKPKNPFKAGCFHIAKIALKARTIEEAKAKIAAEVRKISKVRG